MGAVLLIAAFVLAVMDYVIASTVILIAVGILDIWIIFFQRELSISAYIRGLAPWSIDRIILIGLVPLCWWLNGLKVALWFTLGLLNAHLFNIQNPRR